MFNLSLWITDSHQLVLESNVCRKPGSMLASGCKDVQNTDSVLTEWPVKDWCKESPLSNVSPTVRRFPAWRLEIDDTQTAGAWGVRSGQDWDSARGAGCPYTVDWAVALLTFAQHWKWLRARPSTEPKTSEGAAGFKPEIEKHGLSLGYLVKERWVSFNDTQCHLKRSQLQ